MKWFIVSLFFLLVIGVCVSESRRVKFRSDGDPAATLPPVVLVPGTGGSQLSGINVNLSFTCAHQNSSGDFPLWLSLRNDDPLRQRCLYPFLPLQYNANGTYYNTTNHKVFVTYPWSTQSISNLLYGSTNSLFDYFKDLIGNLTANGYTEGVNLLAAPYDWRLGPITLGSAPVSWYDQLQARVERLYTSAGNTTGVVFIAHSLGNRIIHKFLTTRTAAWKSKYVAGFISVSPPWTGSVDGVQALVSGIDLGDPEIIERLAVTAERTLETTYLLVPDLNYYSTNQAVVTVRQNLGAPISYFARNFSLLFNLLDITNFPAKDAYANNYKPLYYDDPTLSPGVKTIIAYGDIPDTTPYTLHYENIGWVLLSTDKGRGDKTVPYQSLVFPVGRWGSDLLNTYPYAGEDHTGILKSQTVINDIITWIKNFALP